jgi:hypothetical protein
MLEEKYRKKNELYGIAIGSQLKQRLINAHIYVLGAAPTTTL